MMAESFGFKCVNEHHYLDRWSGSFPAVVDIGANHGEFSKKMIDAYGGGNYYLFEANPRLADGIDGGDEQMEVYNKAVAAGSGHVTLNLAENDEASSLLELPDESVYGAKHKQSIRVEKVTLADVLDHLGEDTVDLLKMDIEGAEVEVLGNMSEKEARSISQITVEFHSDPRFGFGLQKETESVIRRLSNLGFLPLDFSRPHRMDVLFLNRRHFKISPLQAVVWKTGVEWLPYAAHTILHSLGLRPKNRR